MQLDGIWAFSLARQYNRLQAIGGVRVRNGQYHGFGHGGVLDQQRFEFEWVHLVGSNIDQELDPPREPQDTLIVQRAEVARAQKTDPIWTLLTFQVSTQHSRCANGDFPLCPGWEWPLDVRPFEVEYARLHTIERTPH